MSGSMGSPSQPTILDSSKLSPDSGPLRDHDPHRCIHRSPVPTRTPYTRPPAHSFRICSERYFPQRRLPQRPLPEHVRCVPAVPSSCRPAAAAALPPPLFLRATSLLPFPSPLLRGAGLPPSASASPHPSVAPATVRARHRPVLSRCLQVSALTSLSLRVLASTRISMTSVSNSISNGLPSYGLYAGTRFISQTYWNFPRKSSYKFLRIRALQGNDGRRRLVDIIRIIPELSRNYFRSRSRRALFGGIALLGGFYVAQTISLSFGALAVNDVIAAVVCVLLTEYVTKFYYSRPKVTFPIALLNNFKMGFTYGLFIDAFKLAS